MHFSKNKMYNLPKNRKIASKCCSWFNMLLATIRTFETKLKCIFSSLASCMRARTYVSSAKDKKKTHHIESIRVNAVSARQQHIKNFKLQNKRLRTQRRTRRFKTTTTTATYIEIEQKKRKMERQMHYENRALKQSHRTHEKWTFKPNGDKMRLIQSKNSCIITINASSSHHHLPHSSCRVE